MAPRLCGRFLFRPLPLSYDPAACRAVRPYVSARCTCTLSAFMELDTSLAFFTGGASTQVLFIEWLSSQAVFACIIANSPSTALQMFIGTLTVLLEWLTHASLRGLLPSHKVC